MGAFPDHHSSRHPPDLVGLEETMKTQKGSPLFDVQRVVTRRRCLRRVGHLARSLSVAQPTVFCDPPDPRLARPMALRQVLISANQTSPQLWCAAPDLLPHLSAPQPAGARHVSVVGPSCLLFHSVINLDPFYAIFQPFSRYFMFSTVPDSMAQSVFNFDAPKIVN